MTEIKENPLFLRVVAFCMVLPFCFYQWLNTFVLAILGLTVFVGLLPFVLLRTQKQATAAAIKQKSYLLIVAIFPFIPIFAETVVIVIDGFGMFIVMAVMILLANQFKKMKWLNYIVVFTLLLMPICFYFQYDEEKQAIRQQQTLTVSGSLPAQRLSIDVACRTKNCTDDFLVLGHIHFFCEINRVNKIEMDTFICQDIYQHAGKTATAQYILENQKEARLVSLRVGSQTLWSPEQTLAWYQHRERTVWREFWAGLLLIGLPFALLFLWARRLAFQAT